MLGWEKGQGRPIPLPRFVRVSASRRGERLTVCLWRSRVGSWIRVGSRAPCGRSGRPRAHIVPGAGGKEEQRRPPAPRPPGGPAPNGIPLCTTPPRRRHAGGPWPRPVGRTPGPAHPRHLPWAGREGGWARAPPRMASHYRPIRWFPLPFRMLTRNGPGAGPGPRLPGSAVMRYEPRAPVGRPRAPGPARRTPGPTGRRAAQGPPALPPPHWPAGGTAPRGRGRRVKEVRTRSVRTSSQYIYIIRAKCEHWRRARLRAGPGGGPGRRGAGLSGAHKGPARPTPADGAGHERRELLRSTRTGSGSRRGPSERTASASRRSGSGSHRKGTRGRGGGKTRSPHPRNTGDAPRGPPTTETHRSAFFARVSTLGGRRRGGRGGGGGGTRGRRRGDAGAEEGGRGGGGGGTRGRRRGLTRVRAFPQEERPRRGDRRRPSRGPLPARRGERPLRGPLPARRGGSHCGPPGRFLDGRHFPRRFCALCKSAASRSPIPAPGHAQAQAPFPPPLIGV
uniref:Uncharacterized protein n=1 Tax=Human herpesvirus 1 TaxID=10298 RepID=A0A2Z4H984_HHV1|nr:hypothetical protein [Human alphaherpesvirus 1]